MKKTILAALAISLAAPMAAQADTIFGIYASAGKWNQDFSGQVGTAGASVIDLQDDLGFDDGDGNTLSLAIEHPIPVIPNFRFSTTDLKETADNTITRQITFEGETFAINSNVHTNLDLSHKDYLLYYEILDNWVTLDIGLNARQFDGKVNLSTNADSGEATLDATVPMLYGRLEFELPLTGLSVGAEMMGISAGDASMKDIKARIAYELSFGLGIEVGQRTFTIEYDPDDPDNDEVITDLEFKGSYVAMTYHF